LVPTLERVGRGGKLPHWFEQLAEQGTLPNLDGKTIGSIVEMLLIAVLESHAFAEVNAPALRINPARGVDLPDLDLGVKSPSENFCTSEPFFSAYERLYGSEYDAVVLLTDYQTAKKSPPLRLQIIRWDYLTHTQLADEKLCRIARKHRASLLADSEARAQRLFRFLAYVNQGDWLGRKLVAVVDSLDDAKAVDAIIQAAEKDFKKTNAALQKKKKFEEPIPDASLEALRSIASSSPLLLGIIDAADNWVAETLKEAARLPNENEWKRLKSGPLDGRIGMSFALQWRYSFGRLFGLKSKTDELSCEPEL
jgi:hypothetical protein